MFPPHIKLTAQQIIDAINRNGMDIYIHDDPTDLHPGHRAVLEAFANLWNTIAGKACTTSALIDPGHAMGSMEAFFIDGFSLGYGAALSTSTVNNQEVN